MYDRILYPVDGSDGAAAALENVRDLAATYDATVHLLFVTTAAHTSAGLGGDPNRGSSRGMVGDPEGDDVPMVGDRELREELRREAEAFAEKTLDEVASELDDVETQTAIRSGDPHQVILGYVEKNDIDIIVMGTHGRSGLQRYLLGSVTERVLRTADVPILTVRKEDVPPLEADEIPT